MGVVSPGCVVVDLVQQSISQHSSVLVYEDVFAAVDTDQQTDDVRRAPLPAQFFCREKKKAEWDQDGPLTWSEELLQF